MKKINVKKTVLFAIEAIFAWMLVSGACMFLSMVFQKEFSFACATLIWTVLLAVSIICEKFEINVRDLEDFEKCPKEPKRKIAFLASSMIMMGMVFVLTCEFIMLVINKWELLVNYIIH